MKNIKTNFLKKKFFFITIILTLAVLTSLFINTGSANAQTLSELITFSTPGTYVWTVPTGITTIKIKVWGAGGGGGNADTTCTGFIFESCNNWPGVGGAGGGYAEVTTAVTPGEVFDVTVGKGGTVIAPANAPYFQYDTYNANPSSYASYSAGSSYVKSKTTGKYIGAGGGGGGFTEPGKTVVAYPITDYTGGGVHGKGQSGISGATGAGLAGKIRSWCNDGNNNIPPSCYTAPSGGTGFGTYTGIISSQGSSPAIPSPFPLQIQTEVNGGAGANGGFGGTLGNNGTSPGGGGGPAKNILSLMSGGNGKVTIEGATPSFDFGISNDGDKSITQGSNAVSNISTTLLASLTKDVSLNVESIKNSAGVDVLNTTNGITMGGSSFLKKIVNPPESTTLTLYTTGSTPVGVYDVVVSGTYTKATTVSSSPLTYPCSIVWVTDPQGSGNNQYDGFYFGCSTEANFNPQADYNNGGYYSTECINFDDGTCKVVGSNAYLAGSSGAQKVIDFRRYLANRECGLNNYTIVGTEANASAYFTCNSAPSSSVNSTQTVKHTTTYKINVKSSTNYNLTATPSADGCKIADLNITLNWSAASFSGVSGLKSFTIYKKKANVNEPRTQITVNYTGNNNLTYKDTSFDFNTLYEYSVAAVVSGAVQTESPVTTVYSPKFTCPVVITPVVKLFTKKTLDTTTDLNSFTIATTVTPTNSEIVVPAGTSFDLRWISNLTPDYTCVSSTLTPSNTVNNNIWTNYGNNLNGTAVGEKTSSIATGLYQLVVNCSNGTTPVSSNVVKVTVQPCVLGSFDCPLNTAPDYKFNITTSGDKCYPTDLYIKEAWAPVSNADSYIITRVKDINKTQKTYTISGGATQNIEYYKNPQNTSALPDFDQDVSYSYTVAAVIKGNTQLPSPTIKITSPKLQTTGCPVADFTLGIKRVTDATYSSAVDISKGDQFVLNWASTNVQGTYNCTNTVVKPDGSNGNSLWTWGNSLNGTSVSLNTSQSTVTLGSYKFSIHCVSTSGNPTLDSNIVQLGVRSLTPPPSTDVCPNIPGAQDTVPTGKIIDSGGNCIDDPSIITTTPGTVPPCSLSCPPPAPPDSRLKLFLGNSAIDNIARYNISSTVVTDPTKVIPYKVKKGNVAYIKYFSSLPSNYTCLTKVTKPDYSTVGSAFSWSGNSSLNAKIQALSTNSADTIVYSFQLVCRDLNDSSVIEASSNVVKLQITDSTIQEI